MTTLAQRSFAGGEIAPALYTRCDTLKYTTGARTLRNMLVPRHGGASSRPGTTFVGCSKGSGVARLIPFIFNSSQTYVLEFGGSYIRFYKDGVQLTDVTKTITGITNANPAVVTTSTPHGFSNGDEVQISGITGAIGSYLNGRNFVIAGVTSTTFQLKYLTGGNVDSTTFGAYGSGGSTARVYSIATSYTASELSGIKFIQSADVVTLVHPNHLPQELKRFGDTNWTIGSVTLTPSISAPAGLTAGGTPPGGAISIFYLVTAVSSSGDESFPQNTAQGFSTAAIPTQSSPVNLSWTAVSGAQSYNVYRAVGGGAFGFLANTTNVSYTDIGAGADSSDTPPYDKNLFASSNDYPSAVAYIQQRLAFSCSANNPETTWMSRTGRFKNFTVSTPTKDDDAITFRLVGRQVNSVKHILDVGKMLVLTSGGEWSMNGDASGTITPIAINPKQYSYNGSSDVRPIVIDNTVLYVQARGSIVRDLSYDFQIDGYKGNDLTIFSSHLVKGHTITDWAYCQIPDSIVWAVRDDGVLLGLTYVREQQILAWHRHDLFGGSVESVCSIPEGNEDILYLVVRRVINGQSVRYIERMSTRYFTDVIDYNGIDCSLEYDGRSFLSNSNISKLGYPNMILSGGTAWDNNETLTLTATSGYFASTDVGNAICFYNFDSNGKLTDSVRCTITGYTSSTVVSVSPNKIVPVAFRSIGWGVWARAVDQVGGLWHLEGKTVSVFADGFVVGSPYNSSYPTYTVTNGSITLDQPYAVIRVGLPMTCDLETLDIDTPQGPSLSDKRHLVTKVTAFVEDSRAFWVGPRPPDDDSVDPLQNLTELKIRQFETMDEPIALVTDKVEINMASEWNNNGRVFIRHIDPLPLTILEIAPGGLFPIGRG